MAKVCIVYGFAEGPAIGRGLRQALRAAGFAIVKDPGAADIIIAHSGGCFMLPRKHQAKIVLFVGPTHWPGKPLVVAVAQKTWHDFHYHRRNQLLATWLRKTGWNLVYGGKLARNARMLRNLKQGKAWGVQADKLILVRNRDDKFCTPDLNSLPFAQQPVIVELIGQHDDIWLHPEDYVAVIQ